MTYYLKHRPQTIDELDLASVRERLRQIVREKKFSHAYLFHGPRGSGKTSAARIMAREAGIDKQDLIELDAASHRGIDDIRELRERIGLVPTVGEKKAYIIDEVHMLTKEAFNAILKTLEEPPSHIIFFLCTTEFEKLPETVVSRCVSIPFFKGSVPEIIRALKRAAAREKVKVDDLVLSAVAGRVNGSFREAHTLLEELLTASGKNKKITAGILDKILGESLEAQTENYVRGILAGEASPALSAVREVMESGGRIEFFSKKILEKLRDLLFIDQPGESAYSRDRVLNAVKAVEERTRTIKYSLLPQLPLEIAALELAKAKPAESGKPSGKTGKLIKQRGSKTAAVKGAVGNPAPPAAGAKITLEKFLSKWPDILAGVKAKNHGIVTLLSHCEPTDCADDAVNITVKYKFHKEQLEQERFRKVIEGTAAEVYGVPIRLRYRISPPTQKVLKTRPADDNISPVADEKLLKAAEEIFGF